MLFDIKQCFLNVYLLVRLVKAIIRQTGKPIAIDLRMSEKRTCFIEFISPFSRLDLDSKFSNYLIQINN